MKSKKFVANPISMIVFAAIILLSIAGTVIFIVYTQSLPQNDPVFSVFVSVLLVCMAAAMFVVGYTTGAFDVVILREQEVVIFRFKPIRRYLFSQNTQLYVQKSSRGSRYIEIRFPEYFESEQQLFKGFRLREGYVCITYTKARIKFVTDAMQNYKQNVNPLSLLDLPSEEGAQETSHGFFR